MVRTAIAVIFAVSVWLLTASCERRPAAGEVVLYSSCDEPLLREVVAAFEARHAIKVRFVGDTEATKTTGLVERLLGEKDRPRADVWWSNEALGTAILDGHGLFDPSGAPPGLPEADPESRVHAFALRARAIAYSPKRVQGAAPRDLAVLTGPEWKGRVGIAQPQFGTTRAHMAFLVQRWGEERFRGWLTAMKANGLRVYSGNSAVVRAIADGEIDAGLTDTDDVWTGQREGWSVECVYEEPALVIPNTVALVKGGPNPGAGRVLIEFLLSPEVEVLLGRSDSHNTPVRAGLRGELGPEFERYAVPAGVSPALTGSVEAAMRICGEVLGG